MGLAPIWLIRFAAWKNPRNPVSVRPGHNNTADDEMVNHQNRVLKKNEFNASVFET